MTPMAWFVTAVLVIVVSGMAWAIVTNPPLPRPGQVWEEQDSTYAAKHLVLRASQHTVVTVKLDAQRNRYGAEELHTVDDFQLFYTLLRNEL